MPVLALFMQIALAGAIAVAMVLMLRSIRRRSRLLAGLVLAGAVLHALSAGLLFAVSWLDAPVLRGMHTGDGFWNLAPDARMSYDLAAQAAADGLDVIPAGSPSPTFVIAIAALMDGLGVHPATPLLFNFVCYLAACAWISAAAGPDGAVPDRAAAWPIIGLSFTPMLVFCGTQVLKDTFFATLIVAATWGVRELLRRMEPGPARSWPGLGASAGLFILAIGLIGGVRAYHAALVLGTLGLVALVAAAKEPRRRGWRYAAIAGLVVLGGWWGFQTGAGVYYEPYGRLARNTVNTLTGGLLAPVLDRVPASPNSVQRANLPAAALDAAREGFILSGGGTNLVALPSGGAAAGDVALTPDERTWSRLGATAVGLAAIFVPVTTLEALSLVDISAGGGLLVFTDLDTIVLDVLALCVAWTLYRHRQALRGRGTYLAFCLVPLGNHRPVIGLCRDQSGDSRSAASPCPRAAVDGGARRVRRPQSSATCAVASNNGMTSRPRHVAFVTTTLDVSGAERVIAHLASGMARAGTRASVVALQRRSGALQGLIREPSVTVTDLRMAGPWDLAVLQRLRRWLQRERVDVLVTFLFHGHLVGRLAARTTGVQVLVSSQQVAQWGGPIRRALERWTGRWCDATIAVSESVRDDLVSNYAVPADRIRVIYNAVDLEAFRPSRLPLEHREALIVFGSASRLAREKDHDSLIRGFAAARAARPDLPLQLRLAGTGSLEGRLRALAASFGPSSAISFLGQVNDVRGFHDQLDVYVQPSWTEGLPCAVVEAMAMARPVIATDVPGNRDAIEPGVTGLLIRPGSSEAWRDAILELAGDPARVMAFGRAGQARAMERFDVTRMVEETQRLIDELMH